MRLNAILSIHDVMPETRFVVDECLRYLEANVPACQPAKTTLLVVPGRDWRLSDMDWLHQCHELGYPLALHGWDHRAALRRDLSHQLHAMLLSRDAAEHLSRDAESVMARLQRGLDWFSLQGLAQPDVYVPPAWAAGRLSLAHWRQLPFRTVETLSGVLDVATGTQRALPLAGYEADTVLRELALTGVNAVSRSWSLFSGTPLRIGIHPCDMRLRMSGGLRRDLNRVDRFVAYDDLGALGADPSRPGAGSVGTQRS